MPAHNAKVTVAALLDLLRSTPGKGFTAAELAEHFDCARCSVNEPCRKLAQDGTINQTVGGNRLNLYHVGELIQTMTAPVERYVGDVAQPFRPDNWKPALRGYGARMAAFRDLAMMTRAA